MSFQYEMTSKKGIWRIALSGRLGGVAATEFEQSLQRLFDVPNKCVVMDFSTVEYIASAGLRVVLMAAKQAKQLNGQLVLCGMPPHIYAVFEISGLLKILDVVMDCNQAKEKFHIKNIL